MSQQDSRKKRKDFEIGRIMMLMLSGLTCGPGSPRIPLPPFGPSLPGTPYKIKATHSYREGRGETGLISKRDVRRLSCGKTAMTHGKSTATFFSNVTWFSLKITMRGRQEIRQIIRQTGNQTDIPLVLLDLLHTV